MALAHTIWFIQEMMDENNPWTRGSDYDWNLGNPQQLLAIEKLQATGSDWDFAILLSDGRDSAWVLVAKNATTNSTYLHDIIKSKESLSDLVKTGDFRVPHKGYHGTRVLEVHWVSKWLRPHEMDSIRDSPRQLNTIEDVYAVANYYKELLKRAYDRTNSETHLSTAEQLEKLQGEHASLQASYSAILDKRKREIEKSRTRGLALRNEIENLKMALREKDALFQTIQRERRHAVSLPVEIWQSIFACALPPFAHTDVLPPSPLKAIHLQRVRVLTTIAQVCKIWRDSSLHMLYEQIYLHEPGSIVALANTLMEYQRAEGNINPLQMIRLLYLDVVASSLCENAIAHSLKLIIAQSPHLSGLVVWPRTLVYSWNDKGNFDVDPTTLLVPVADQLSTLSIVHNTFAFATNSVWLSDLLYASQNLVHLDMVFITSVHMTSNNSEEQQLNPPFFPSRLIFEKLKRLRIQVEWSSTTQHGEGLYWSTPCLQELAILARTAEELRNYSPFTQKNGSSIIRLDLRCIPDGSRHQITHDLLKKFLHDCPALRHLCLCIDNSLQFFPHPASGSLPVTHSTLKYMDVWLDKAYHFLPALEERSEAQFWKDGFPALRRYRVLDRTLVYWVPDLPWLLPPEHHTDTITTHRILNAEITEAPFGLFVNGGALIRDEVEGWARNTESEINLNVAPGLSYDEWEGGTDDGTDEDYSPNSSAYTSEWDSDRDAELSSDYHWDNEDNPAQLSMDEVIERWRETRASSEEECL